MVRVLFNTDDHHVHGSAGRGAMQYSATGERYALSNSIDVDSSAVLGSHRCRQYDMHSLLTESRWQGCSVLHLELTSSDRRSMALFVARMKTALAGLVDARVEVVSNHQLRLSHLDIRSAAVDVHRLLPLAEHILCVEVEKPRDWRAPGMCDARGNHASATSSTSPDAAASAASSPAAALPPSHPATLTGPSHAAGAALCCSLLHSRGEFLGALSAEIASCARVQKHLLKVLKQSSGEGQGKAASLEGAELAEAERAEAMLAAEEEAQAAAAAAAAPAGAAAAASAPVPSKKPSPALSARVRLHFQKAEAHRQRLVQLLKSDLPAITLMHTCNVCQRVLRVEGAKEPKASAAAAAAHDNGSHPLTPAQVHHATSAFGDAQAHAQRQAAATDQLARLYAQLTLGASAASGAAAAAAAAAAASPAPSATAVAAASVAHSAVPLSSLQSALSPAAARARLAELLAKQRAATGADGKARRKKIAKKVTELRARYAHVLTLAEDGSEDPLV